MSSAPWPAQPDQEAALSEGETRTAAGGPPEQPATGAYKDPSMSLVEQYKMRQGMALQKAVAPAAAPLPRFASPGRLSLPRHLTSPRVAWFHNEISDTGTEIIRIGPTESEANV